MIAIVTLLLQGFNWHKRRPSSCSILACVKPFAAQSVRHRRRRGDAKAATDLDGGRNFGLLIYSVRTARAVEGVGHGVAMPLRDGERRIAVLPESKAAG